MSDYMLMRRTPPLPLLALWALLGAVAGAACSRVEPASVSNAKEWIGWWALKIDGSREQSEKTLSVKDASGKIVATLRNGSRDSIEITDISTNGQVLMLKYKQPQSRDAANAIATLSMQPDGAFKSLVPGQRTLSGTAKKFTVSEGFVNQLLKESGDALISKAKAAGLVVTQQVCGDRGACVIVEDPATGVAVLTSMTIAD